MLWPAQDPDVFAETVLESKRHGVTTKKWIRRSRMGQNHYRYETADAGKIVICQNPSLHQTVAGYSGGTVWDSAVVLAKYLERNLDMFSGKQRILEIGSGCGLVGIVLSHLLESGHEFLLTDLDEMMPLLTQNINEHCKATSTVKPVTLFWGADISHVPQPVDIIIGADVTYHKMSIDLLMKSLLDLSQPHTKVVLAHEMRGSIEEELFFRPISKYFDIIQIPGDGLDPVFHCDDIQIFILTRREQSSLIVETEASDSS